MREVKFRAMMVKPCRGHDGIWVTMRGISTFNQWSSENGTYYGDVAGETKTQYTGLNDKQGKEIYEGDIVKTNEAGWVAKVIYSRGCFMCIGLEGTGFSVECNWGEFEVIGNIYENPDMVVDE